MLLSEMHASSLTEIRRNFEDAFPRMTDKELFKLIDILYKYQTPAEQASSSVHVYNNRGFSITDAEKLTNFWRWYMKRHFYTPKQKQYIINLLRKHCGQLIKHWIDCGTIKRLGRGDYEYVSKAERLQKLQQNDSIRLPVEDIQTDLFA